MPNREVSDRVDTYLSGDAEFANILRQGLAASHREGAVSQNALRQARLLAFYSEKDS